MNPRLQLAMAWEKVDNDFRERDVGFASMVEALSRRGKFSLEKEEQEILLEGAGSQLMTAVDEGDLDRAFNVAEFLDYTQKSYGDDSSLPIKRSEENDKVLRNATCALRADDGTIQGTGVLIGPGMILTCAHVFDDCGGSVKRCDALFTFGNPVDFIPVSVTIDQLIYRSKDSDFVLLRINDTSISVLGASPLTMALYNKTRNSPLRVAGHRSKGKTLVTCGGAIVYPYEESQINLLKMFSKEVADYCGKAIVVQWPIIMDDEKLSFEEKVNRMQAIKEQVTGRVKSFYESYYTGFNPNASEGDCRFIFDKIGSIGTNSDTMRGDSGAPVIDANSGYLIGLLRGGIADGVYADRAGYTAFEHVIAIAAIVNELNAADGAYLSTCTIAKDPVR